MKRMALVGALAIGLLPLSLGSTGANAADYLYKSINCPVTDKPLLAGGEGQIRITDVILSANVNTDVKLQFFGEGANRTIMKVYLGKNRTVVTNFQEGVEGDIDQGLRMSCGESGKVSVTIVGS